MCLRKFREIYLCEKMTQSVNMCRFEAGQGYECMSELQEAARRSADQTIRAWTKFVGAYLSHILHRPLAIYQLASQQVSRAVCLSTSRLVTYLTLSVPLLF